MVCKATTYPGYRLCSPCVLEVRKDWEIGKILLRGIKVGFALSWRWRRFA